MTQHIMDTSAFIAIALACAPQVHADTTSALVQVESAFNPWAIGVVGGALERQPRNRAEAVATARQLREARWNFSVGLAQINVANFARLGLSLESAFDTCTNLAAMQTVLVECFGRASTIARPAVAHPATPTLADQLKLRAALSCYYSGNFSTGLQQDYVHRVGVAAAAQRRLPLPTVSMEPA